MSEDVSKENIESKGLAHYLKLMREIGSDIASISDHVQMVELIYEKVNSLMDASVLAVSYYDENSKELIIPCTIEKGELLPKTTLTLDNNEILAVKCFKENRELLLNDMPVDLPAYGIPALTSYAGEIPESIIYIPLETKGKALGTITVQSFQKKAYSSEQIELLRILAIYTSISIENRRSLESVEEQVKERTTELRSVNARASAVNEIGYSIAALHSIEDINQAVYRDLSSLMIVDGFGLGIYNELKHTIEFDGYIENGKTFNDISYDLEDDRLCNSCFRERRTLHMNEVTEMNDFLKTPQEVKYGASCESIIYTPLIVNEQCVGVLTVQSMSKNAYSISDVGLIESLSAFVASALANAKLIDHLGLLSNLGKEITSSLSVVEIADKLYQGLTEVLDTTIFLLSEYDPHTRNVNYMRFYEAGELLGEGKGHNIDETESFAGWNIRNKEAILINNQSEFKKYLEKPLTGIGDLPHSLISLPLIYKNECLGVLTVQSFDENAYTKAQLELLQTISSSLAVAMNHAKIHRNIEEITQLGTKITGMSSIEEISILLNKELSNVMSAEGFGIGYYNPFLKGLEFGHYIECNEFLPHHVDPFDSERLSVICFQNEQTILTGNLEDFKKYLPESYSVEVGEDTISIIYVPLKYSGKCLGVVTVQSEKENAFNSADVQLLESLAPYLAVALDNIRAFNNLKSLSEIGREVTSTLDIQAIADELYHSLSKLLDTFTFLLASFNSSRELIEYIRVYENRERIADGVSYGLSERESLATVCIREKSILHLSEHEEKSKYIKLSKAQEGASHESIIYVPIVFEDEVLGVFSVQSQKKFAYSKYHVEVLKTIASYLGVAFNNALSHEELKLINELGQEITSKTDPIDVLYTSYSKLSQILKLDGFGIGVHNPVSNTIDFPGYIEAGIVLKPGQHSMDRKIPSTWCFKNQKVIHINKLEELEQYKEGGTGQALDGEVCKSIIYVPVNLGEAKLGVATIQSFAENSFNQKNINLFKNLCSYIAVAIDNSRSYSNLTTLSDIGKTITSTFDMKLIADTLYSRLSALMEVNSFILGTYDSRTQDAKLVKMIEDGELLAEDHVFNMADVNTVSKKVVLDKQALIVKSREELLEKIPDLKHDEKDGEPVQSMIYMPIVFDSEVLGFVSVQNKKRAKYNDRHLEVLKNICAYLAVSFNNARSYETINRIAEVGQEITSNLNLAFVFDSVYNSLKSLMHIEFLVISEYDAKSELITNRFRIEDGVHEVAEVEYSAKKGDSPGAWVVQNKKEIHINDLPNEYKKYFDKLDVHGNMPMSVIYKPLMSGSEVIGVISIQSYEKNAYNNYHLQLLDLISPYVTSALQNGLTYEKLEQAHVELEKLSIVASETDNAIIIADPDGKYEWVNKACSEMTGKSLEELANGKNTIQTMSSFDGINEAVQSVKDSKQSLIYESEMATPNGKIWAQTTLTPILSSENELLKLVAIDSDITEMKKAQRALKRSEEDYKRLFEKISDSIFITNKETGTFMDCNNAVLEIYGYSKEEILQMRAIDFHPEREIIEDENGNRQIDFNTEQFHHIKSNGEEIMISVSSVEIHYRGVEATLSIIRDITETKMFEQKILEQNAELEKLSIVASSTDNVVIICNAEGDLIWANESYERVFGKTLEERKEQTGGNLLKGSGNSKIKTLVDQCVRTGKGVSYESNHINAEGKKLWLQSTLTPVLDEEGKLKNLVIIDADITIQKMNELLVMEKNKDITDSINYASRLQKAILPDQSEFNQVMDGAFVYFEPRDIVSGDFYWMTKTNEGELIVAAIDCTGHGVPGAFLTITGNDLLNHIVKLRGINDPSEILDRMNSGLLKRLHTTTDTDIKDGMDMTICKISRSGDEFEVDYAGAFNPLYYVVNNELLELKGNRFAIGTNLSEDQSWKGEKVVLPKESMVYLFSDGYHDQLGGKKGKKFMKSKFRQLLLEISNLEVQEQHDKLKSKFDEWSGDMAQVDDVLVMGIRL